MPTTTVSVMCDPADNDGQAGKRAGHQPDHPDFTRQPGIPQQRQRPRDRGECIAFTSCIHTRERP